MELLVHTSRVWYFEGNQHGLRDREWMALRFLGRANRFSRTPSALAGFISATRTTASQIVKTLEGKSFLVRKPSQKDKRSVVLHLAAQGEKCLSQHDPVNHVLNAVTALGPDACVRLRDSLREILNHLDAAHQRLDARVCRDCMFLAERRPGTDKRRATAEFLCGCIAPRFRSRRPNCSASISSASATDPSSRNISTARAWRARVEAGVISGPNPAQGLRKTPDKLRRANVAAQSRDQNARLLCRSPGAA
ncbi:transcriptional regulatory protein [Bradyrhizobium sp.]|nr:transcriptional regulatory protein [Bradyrhizobium sp.]